MKIHGYSSKETFGPWWHHGRAWLRSGDTSLSVELVTGKRAHFGGVRLKIGGQTSEQWISGMIGFPYLATFYWGIELPRGWYKFLLRNSHTTAIELNSGPWSVGWTIWKYEDWSWRASDRWWQRRSYTINLHRLIFGQSQITTETVEGPAAVTIHMPEGPYSATVKIERAIWKFRFGHTKVHHWYVVDIDGYIPVPGKGTASYNSGPDGIFSMSGPGKHIEDGIADVIRSALRTRREHGEPADYAVPI